MGCARAAAFTALVAEKTRWGGWKDCDRLWLDGHWWNHKRRVARGLPAAAESAPPNQDVGAEPHLDLGPEANVGWAIDFMSETLYGGRRFRTCNGLDEGGREAGAIEVATSLSPARVVRVLAQVMAWRGQPQPLNGPEFLDPRPIR